MAYNNYYTLKILDGIIGAKFEKIDVTMDTYPKEFNDIFDEAVKFINQMKDIPIVSKEEENEIKQDYFNKYLSKCTYQSPDIVSLVDHEHEEWLEKKNSSIKWRQWEKYSAFLETEKKFSKKNIEAIGKLADKIIDRLEDPEKENYIHVKGLLMGEVQSGKTGSFMAVLHKAVDVGWRFLIVLSGVTDDLRHQTQQRINFDFIGYTLSALSDHQNCGIREKILNYDIFDIEPLTDLGSDFNKENCSGKILKNDSKKVYILVCKKNASILKNLLTWLGVEKSTPTKFQDRREIAKKMPCLIIDDEADQASPNTKENIDEYTAVNRAIRNLLRFFEKSAYLAVTATPYANIFINPFFPESAENENRLQDLFPKNFIFVKPTPIGYTGVNELFGSNQKSLELNQKVIITIEQNDEELFRKPLKKDDHIDKLPRSLVTALRYFFCCCVYKEITVDSHVSMLTHIDFRKEHHHTIAELIDEFYNDELNSITLEQGLSGNELQFNDRYNEYRYIWEHGCFSKNIVYDPNTEYETFRSLSKTDFSTVWKSYLCNTLKKVRIETINSDRSRNSSSKAEKLANIYEKCPNSKLILVGGNALSRGITIEGLCVTYLTRSCGAIDTLLQMGRFFGYKGYDIKIMKIWLTQNIQEMFEEAAIAQQEFVEQVKIMNDHNETPSTFGFRIHKAPAYLKLRIAARNKMYHSTTVTLNVNIAGHPLQSSKLPLDIEMLKKNKEIVSSFVNDLSKNHVMPQNTPGKYEDIVWTNVDSNKIAKLIADFNAFGWGDINKESIASYINDKLANEKWIVSVISNKKEKHDKYDLFNLKQKVVAVPSKVYVKQIENIRYIYFSNGSLMRGSDLTRRLTNQEKNQLLENSGKEQLDNGDVVRNRCNLNLHPQLLIYSVQPDFFKDEITNKDYADLVCGLAIGVPCNHDLQKTEVKLKYDVNDIYMHLLNLNSEGEY